MCFDDPTTTPDPESFTVKIDIYFTIFYTTEMTIKIIGGGLFYGREPYLADAANWLDGIVVIFSLIELAVKDPIIKG